MGTLATESVLVLSQITSFARCDFDILGADGAVVGSVTTEGGAVTRLITGPRRLTVLDGDGMPYVVIDDPPNLGRDRYDLYDGSGVAVGRITKEVTFLRKRLTIEVGDRSFELNERDLRDREFDIAGPSGRLASVRRDWPGIGSALLGRSRYVVGFEADEDPEFRRAALGAVLAVELIRLKARSSDGAAVG